MTVTNLSDPILIPFVPFEVLNPKNKLQIILNNGPTVKTKYNLSRTHCQDCIERTTKKFRHRLV